MRQNDDECLPKEIVLPEKYCYSPRLRTSFSTETRHRNSSFTNLPSDFNKSFRMKKRSSTTYQNTHQSSNHYSRSSFTTKPEPINIPVRVETNQCQNHSIPVNDVQNININSNNNDNFVIKPTKFYRISVKLGTDVKPEELNIHLKSGLLTITVKQTRENFENNEQTNIAREFLHENTIPINVDQSKLIAKLDKGILTWEAPYMTTTTGDPIEIPG
ncbi:unnamed protein product [Schistosoma turkestanicum]|nr:unnamed protein product [Schistosoma turkestanicum]